VKLTPPHPIRSGLDHLIQNCPGCHDGTDCARCAGLGVLPVEPVRVLLDYLARSLAHQLRG